MPFHRSAIAAAALGVACTLGSVPSAQQRPRQFFVPPLSDATGEMGVGLALRTLATVGTFMHTTAHPDDENNGVLAYYAREKGMRVALVTATRGDGGQNEIGPELFDGLAMLRTEELLAAHRWDGAEQYFTRAVDFGYSFSTDETLQKWGRQEILGDFVRMIRTIRPDVIVSLGTEGTGGGQHHQTSAILTREAFRAAADPGQFPEQIKEGLRPWQAKKLYQPGGGFGGFGPGGPGGRGGGRGGAGGRGGRGGAPGGRGAAPADAHVATIDTSGYDALIGCTIGEVGSLASGMHRCQGRTGLIPIQGQSGARYRLADTVLDSQKDKDETSLFDGVDVSLASIAHFAGANPPAALTGALAQIQEHVDAAQRAFTARGPAATLPDLAAGLAAVRALRSGLGSMSLEEGARYEIDFRLARKDAQFQQALVLAHAVRVDAIANDGVVFAGQSVQVTVTVANRGAEDLSVKRVSLAGFDGDASCSGSPRPAAPLACVADVKIPGDAKLTDKTFTRLPDFARYVFDPDAPFGVPFKPTPFRATIEFDMGGTAFTAETPVQYRYQGDLVTGEKRMELQVVPAFAVSMTPDIAIVPLKVRAAAAAARPGGADPRAREIRVTVVNGTKGAASGTVTLETPAGWKVTPPANAVAFTREDESTTVRFLIHPPASLAAGEVVVHAMVAGVKADGLSGAERFDKGYDVIEYPHTQRRHKVTTAETAVKVIDVAVAPNLTVGYVMGVGDQVPPALQQLGVRLEFIDSDTLAWGDLSKYDVIVTGVRAYERRQDLIANNNRLLRYIENGGTVICQYNKMEFNEAQYGPYPAQVSNNRVTEEAAPVNVLQKEHPVFNFPNRIAAPAWDHWVQERGLYFLGEKDPRYVDLVQMEDPFPYNPGVKGGALVEATYGKGHWIYVGLGLWRQLPAGTEGAYQLFANLLSLPKATKARPQAPLR
jgi:GlcNAc-PI de-N-acetylase